ncbi:aminotransferase class IV [Clostridium tarantellae]|uniref:4-amino-4-deoxychorismate lyase n=1 Tax=Clostridium tarantellae TaxID=39493 RepID=A0A6I1ML40_9CLOT|nr:aminotransferase class IV [Clostridium tarantellae]MPQ44115.1 4-amino-4-deoxychorismate lyase [Clostridium tarantellae]
MIYINGKKNGEFILDSSMYFGEGVFETIYVNEQAIFLKEHIERLNNSSKILGINKEINFLDVKNFIEEKKIRNCALKINLTEKNIIFSTKELTYKREHYEKGFSLALSKVIRNSTSILTYIKSMCYIENLIEKKKAIRQGFEECIFLNEKGFLTEGSTSNMFFVKKNKIYTPAVSCGLLNGIVRRWIINNFKVIEGEFLLKDLHECEGIFLTNSLMGIMNVRNFNNIKFETNNIIKEIQKYYLKEINGGFSL